MMSYSNGEAITIEPASINELDELSALATSSYIGSLAIHNLELLKFQRLRLTIMIENLAAYT